MKAVCFDPINGEGQKIPVHELYSLKQKRNRQKSVIIMCRHCKTILHESRGGPSLQTAETKSSTSKSVLVGSFKNAKVSCEADRLLFYCNICGQEIGEVNQPSSSISLRGTNILPAVFDWKATKSRQEEGVPVGCYSGVSINNLQKIITRLVYMKCRRYQETMQRFQKNIRETLKGFVNFILLINIYKAEEDNPSIPPQFPRPKASINQQTSLSRTPLAKQKYQTLTDHNCLSEKHQHLFKERNHSKSSSCFLIQRQTNPTLPSIREQQD